MSRGDGAPSSVGAVLGKQRETHRWALVDDDGSDVAAVCLFSLSCPAFSISFPFTSPSRRSDQGVQQALQALHTCPQESPPPRRARISVWCPRLGPPHTCPSLPFRHTSTDGRWTERRPPRQLARLAALLSALLLPAFARPDTEGIPRRIATCTCAIFRVVVARSCKDDAALHPRWLLRLTSRTGLPHHSRP